MPIPFFLIGLGAATTLLGVGKSIKAAVDQKDAKETNEYADDIVDTANNEAKKARNDCNAAIENLGNRKILILNGNMHSFIESFEKLHSIDHSDIKDLDAINKDSIDFEQLKTLTSMAASLASGVASGAALGAITAFGAYGAATTFGACATTGTLISTLSGVAASNATLAFLGGGALSVGGLGVAGGTAVLGGLVAGPALAVMGFIVGAKASKNKDEAYSNLAKAKEFREEVKTIKQMCSAIRRRANMYNRLLINLDMLFTQLIFSLDNIIATSGTNFSTYSVEEKKTVAACLSMASTINTVLNTAILTEDGNLSDNSLNTYNTIQNQLAENDNIAN